MRHPAARTLKPLSAIYDDIAMALSAHGLLLRGGFHPSPADAIPSSGPMARTATVLMIGNAGGTMWRAFEAQRPDGPNPLDRWTRQIIDDIAGRFGATAVYPYDNPPLPFQRWAARAWPLSRSPIGLLIDAEYGLWHALRAALLVPSVMTLPARHAASSPCETCAAKPCLSACPVDAFSAAGFDVPACRNHLVSARSDACHAHGCRARDACPVGTQHRYSEAQVRFHMRAFSGIAR